MRKLFLLFAILLVAAPAGFAQSEYSNWEFFIGYAHERGNNGADRLDARGLSVSPTGVTRRVDFVSKNEPHHGVTGEVVGNVSRHIGLVANFAVTFADAELQDRVSGKTFNAKITRYTVLGGPRFNWRNSSAFTPFAHALFGASRYSASFKNHDFTCPDTSETAFAMALGAGLDIKASNKIDIRPIQVDYLPVFFSNRREDNLRFSAGIKIK